MVILRVDHNHCEGDCIAKEGYLLINTPKCKENRSLRINRDEILCSEINDVSKIGLLKIIPGERKMIGNGIFIDYPAENRVYLDYDMYYKIIKIMKIMHLKKLQIDKIVFSHPILDCVFTNFGQQICVDGITLDEGEQSFLTKNGIKDMTVTRGGTVYKGECEMRTNSLVLCYDDPKS